MQTYNIQIDKDFIDNIKKCECEIKGEGFAPQEKASILYSVEVDEQNDNINTTYIDVCSICNGYIAYPIHDYKKMYKVTYVPQIMTCGCCG